MFAVTRRRPRVFATRRHLARRRVAQGFFSATILVVLVAFEGFTLSPCYRHRGKATGAQICNGVSLVLSGALRKRVVAEGSAALTRLS